MKNIILALCLALSVCSCARAQTADFNQRILSISQESLGKKMWSGFALPNGKLGCAAALSNILNKAGFKCPGSAVVVVLRRQILNHQGVKELTIKNSADWGVDKGVLATKARPGDLIFGYMQPVSKPNLGGNAHCAIVAGSGEVMGNDWNDGIWKKVDADQYFSFYHYVYLIKLP